MRPTLPAAALVLLLACAGQGPGPVAPPLVLPESISVVDGRTGRVMPEAELVHQLRDADFVLLGEVHDNPVHHAARALLVAALGSGRPAVVFEQLAESHGPIAPPVAGEALEDWLDRHGFDRRSWRWPLHRPVVEAAIAHGRSLWGSGLSREALRAVVREGEGALPDALRALSEAAPLDSAARAVMDRILVDGHCGRLPEAMIPGMRAAQVARDAAMTRALVLAERPAILIAGNGHVRADLAVPRLLRRAVPAARVVAVGSLERAPDGAAPPPTEMAAYDIVLITPRVERTDPCAGVPAR